MQCAGKFDFSLLRNTPGDHKMSSDLLPYTSVYIDAQLEDLSSAALECLHTNHDRKSMILELQNMWTTTSNPNPVLPVLSVRTGFDLFLRLMNFPSGSEVIMSAINIPDMVKIVRHHKLNIVPLDISIDTVAPKTHLLPQLVSSRTVAIVIAHLYGKWVDMEDIITFANKHKLYVVEDCAECFCGFDKLSHPQTDVALFSFGIIKFYTSFGGAIAKIKPSVYAKMAALQETYRVQSQATFLKKILKYVLVYMVLNNTTVNYHGIKLLRYMGYPNFKDSAVKMLRGFPNDMLERIREQPSNALLATMLKRQKSFSPAEFCLQRLKGDYVTARLSPFFDVVGAKAAICNYWLFPIVAEDPDHLTHLLNMMGVEAYRGATQLNIVEPMNGNPEPLLVPDVDRGAFHTQAPHEGGTGTVHIASQISQVTESFEKMASIARRSLDMGYIGNSPEPNISVAAVGEYDDNVEKRTKTDDNRSDQAIAFSTGMFVGSGRMQQTDPELSDADNYANHVPAVNHRYPHEAKYLVDHVLYLPVNKLVPFHTLDRMVTLINNAVALDKSSRNYKVKVVLPSKL